MSRKNRLLSMLGLNVPEDKEDGHHGELNNLQVTGEDIATRQETDGFTIGSEPIGVESINKLNQIYMTYRQGKSHLEKRIIDNEDWYRGHHWETFDTNDKKIRHDIEPVSRYLFNAIANKHAEGMDNFPSPNVLPREENDKIEAEILSKIIPVILDQCEFEQTYNDCLWYKLQHGVSVYGIYWDGTKNNGMGDIAVRKEDILDMYWQSGITDIQDSKYVFVSKLEDNDILLSKFPELEGHLGKNVAESPKYRYDDTIDTTNKSVVMDVYYKRTQTIATGQVKTILHYVKYCNDVVLYATENDPNAKDRGLYDHGLYPFVFDTMYPVEGTPVGFGLIDISRNQEEYIDRLNQTILENAQWTAKPRYFVSDAGNVNVDEFADLDKNIVHVSGAIVNDSIQPIVTAGLSSIYPNIMMAKVEEIKEITGNRDVSTGGTTGGVTSASGIASMQEASSKTSRDITRGGYRAYRKIILFVIELIRQFYDTPRYFRIAGQELATEYEFVRYTNENIQPQPQGGIEFGVDMGYRLPLFDVEVSAEKSTSYTRVAQNELALQFYNLGFFNPLQAEQALACLEMMDFDRKENIIKRIQQNSMLMQTLNMLTGGAMMPQGGTPSEEDLQETKQSQTMAKSNDVLGGKHSPSDNTINRKARERTAEQTRVT